MNIAILTISGLSLAVSITTLSIVLIAGKKAQNEMTDVKTNANKALGAARDVLNSIEL
jgi:hypothetical protein